MADAKETAAKQLREITECPICMNVFTDPRALPCIHTFCLECLKRISGSAQKDPGDKLPCPLCRKEFLIPADGINGVPKNFFLENLLQYKMTLQMGSTSIVCDLCSASDESKTGQVPIATMRCLECEDNYCDGCVKIHQNLKISRDHKLVKIGDEAATSGIKRIHSLKYCSEHNQKPLEYYCADCKKIVCVSCFVERHKLHDCKDIATVDEDFRHTIEQNAGKISNYAEEMLVMRESIEKKKADFLKEIVAKENAVHKRNQELKEMIDRDTKLLLDELSAVKSNQLKKIEDEVEITDRSFTILKGFEDYCTELVSKGSASDICNSYDELILRANGLEKDHEEFIARPRKSVEISFQRTDFREVIQKFSNNIVGIIQETTSEFENYVFVLGIDDGAKITKGVVKMNLQRPNEISMDGEIPSTMMTEAVGAVYCNTMYVAGLGDNADEIWKYNVLSGWKKCASLVQGRMSHSAAFIDEVLYICGGFVNRFVLDSVEAFNAIKDECNTAGKLVLCVRSSGNCVPFRNSIYIFGGKNKYQKDLSHVQVYDTKQNTCTLLSKPMPRRSFLMRAALCETFAILVGQKTCFIFDFEAETWQEREQFKTEVRYFGLVLHNEKVFVFGGGDSHTDKAMKKTWQCRDDVRYVPLQNILQDKSIEWKIHGKLPNPSLVQAYGVMAMTV